MDLQSFYLAASLQMVVLQGLHFKEDLFMTACVTYFYKLQHDKDISAEWMLMPKNEHVYISKYFC